MTHQPENINTEDFAKALAVKAQSVRHRLCTTGSYFGIRPFKTPSGRLMWPADGPQRLIEKASGIA
jgi:hypothetical protein